MYNTYITILIYTRKILTITTDDYLFKHVNVDLAPCDDFFTYACQYNTTGADEGSSGKYHHNYEGTDFSGKKHVLTDVFHGKQINHNKCAKSMIFARVVIS